MRRIGHIYSDFRGDEFAADVMLIALRDSLIMCVLQDLYRSMAPILDVFMLASRKHYTKVH